MLYLANPVDQEWLIDFAQTSLFHRDRFSKRDKPNTLENDRIILDLSLLLFSEVRNEKNREAKSQIHCSLQ